MPIWATARRARRIQVDSDDSGEDDDDDESASVDSVVTGKDGEEGAFSTAVNAPQCTTWAACSADEYSNSQPTSSSDRTCFQKCTRSGTYVFCDPTPTPHPSVFQLHKPWQRARAQVSATVSLKEVVTMQRNSSFGSVVLVCIASFVLI